MTTQTNRSTSHLGAWALVIAVTALGGPASAQFRQDGGSGMTVYADINYGGQSVTFRGDTPNTAAAGWNDNISSIRIPNGETWQICQDVDYRSQCQTVTGNVADLRTMGWNDRISSVRRVNNSGYRDGRYGDGRDDRYGDGRDGRYGDRRSGGAIGTAGSATSVTVYVNPNFGGQSETFRNDTPNLVSFNLNDKVSSIRIPNGEAWEVCQDINYGNQCQVLSSSVADLRSMGWNDRISSLRRVDNSGFRDRRPGGVFQSTAQQSLRYYDRPDYRGRSTLVTGNNSSRVGFSAWQGSVQLRGGGTWELCDSSNNCATINQDVSDVSQLGLDDRITSVRAVNNSRYPWNR